MLCVVLVQPSLALAEQGAFGAPLGPKPVGYRVVWATDITRSWQVPDAAGRLQPGPRAVRVSLWYPAKPGSGRAMTFRNYMEPPVARHVPKSLAEAIHANDIGSPTYSFRGIYRDDVAAFERAMKSSVAARDSASPAPGRYPVVIYSVGQNDFSQDAVCMAEWLASNGCIVASVPHLGTSPRRTLLFVHDPLSYETQLRDLEVALKEALKLTTADPNRILAMGHSYGGIYALLLAMRGNSIRGVIGLDPTYVAQRASYEYDLRKFPYFDADVRVPIATLRRGSGSINRDLLNSLTHAERLEIEYPDLMHGDFTTVAYIRRDLPPALQLEEETKVRSPQVAAAGASSVFHQVEALIEAIFSGNRLEAAVKKDGTKQVTTYTSALSTPTTEELYWIYRSKGLEGARTAIQESRAQAPETMVFSEPRMLTIARELGYSGKNNESLDMFRLAAVAFPDSSSAQLAAAEALIDAGLKAEARVLIESALKRDPKNQSAVDLLAKTKE
jgi:acetyl esterase/lipase